MATITKSSWKILVSELLVQVRWLPLPHTKANSDVINGCHLPPPTLFYPLLWPLSPNSVLTKSHSTLVENFCSPPNFTGETVRYPEFRNSSELLGNCKGIKPQLHPKSIPPKHLEGVLIVYQLGFLFGVYKNRPGGEDSN